MFLLDTNIFLEILLSQNKQAVCQRFLQENNGNLCVSDFSVHSIGIILVRHKKHAVWRTFIEELLANVELVSLPHEQYTGVADTAKRYGLDFDDAYQCSVAAAGDLQLVTFDRDFENVAGRIAVTFLDDDAP